ncbi:MAG: leucyl/phenylalanyl-tRNA--protein transferase [Bacteroidota bacterium]
MPVYRLSTDLLFPPAFMARSDGMLAVGGDLSLDRLILAYKMGIFPWYNEGEPIIWWSPDPRCVLYPHELKVSKSTRRLIRQARFQVTFDRDFPAVIRACQLIERPGQMGTWLTEDMIEAYTHLHKNGYAHSVEVWQDGLLVGGLYGVSIGNIFFGESMFANVSNASKIGFCTLVKVLHQKGFDLIDCQQDTQHLRSMGAVTIPRVLFLRMMENNMNKMSHLGSWNTWTAD